MDQCSYSEESRRCQSDYLHEKSHGDCVGSRILPSDLQQCIADICTLQKKAVLNVVDAYRIMKTNGPRGRSASDVVLAKGLFISPDIVAVDTAAAKFFNQVREMPLDTVGHLANGEALKIGTMNIDKLNVKRIKM